MGSYAGIRRLVQILCSAFFREIEVIGEDNVPRSRGVLFIAWHPNGMLDPMLLVATAPRHPRFGARHGIFRWPLLGSLLRKAGVVPVYRAMDLRGGHSAPDVKARNAASLTALAEVLASGGIAGLFPEGVSHDAPHPQDLRTGAARIYYEARDLCSGVERPLIIPVGLHYDRKALFRSKALVVYHPPMELPESLDRDPSPGEDDTVGRRRARELTALMDQQLQLAVMATTDWQTHHLLHRTRKLVRAERAFRGGASPGRAKVKERILGFRRVWLAHQALEKSCPGAVDALRFDVQAYQDDLRALGLKDHELDNSPAFANWGISFLLIIQLVFSHLLLPPLMAVGYLVNGPVALLLRLICWVFASEKKDYATIKLFAGAVIFPVTWLAIGMISARYFDEIRTFYPTLPGAPWSLGVFCSVLAVLGGVLAVRNLRLAQRMRRAVRVRLTRRRQITAIEHLRSTRAAIYDRLMTASHELDLPGEVAADGRIIDDGVGSASFSSSAPLER
ncbi:MAG TPA: hypothetical protein DEB46_11345 [Myxococcales bacterium]|nr:hypothetical protein [Myxococcales bacterium]